MAGDAGRGSIKLIAAGETALRAVNGLRGSGRVVAVFRRAVHLELPPAGMAAVCVRDVAPAPLNLVAELSQTMDLGTLFARDDSVRREGTSLVVGELAFDLVSAPVWHPPPPPVAIDWSGLSDRAHICAATAAGVREGLGPLAAATLDGERPDELGALARTAHGPVLLLREGVQIKDITLVCRGARQLVGLGPGLTPSGDDVLVGMLAVLSLAGETWVGEAVAPAVRDTPDFSQAVLLEACRGGFAADVDALARALLAGNADAVDAASRELLDHGATSGSDICAGVALGASLVTDLHNT
ncbi:MAG: DUF2877 domain-containing protein [Candidatus Undinarchaeales archaeon]|jgi:hypothetical protein|nr:DUF2877 domain-containing protein [Candidatus Undinarchaeales archaeon]MDP7493245.1 DUF2877 domain-containing protein [Candidatus Undinarchaeales archaeon]